ncbi:5-exo-hydroxycamphor dehydrogenase [Rhodococcus rhodochrous J45]|uniref:5-exo-hydroxycamphor dehydrogenase n=1 Tax=Rhodococcus rhodochrous J45 TaxID=935266 RepID=A0A562E296_RHORH|nr:zinc-binding dehydrogenase [Rhodococcus rhodochrous]TWH16069.1 5-exo-hydroxycamphor dehydrogenase [Rhodococcus rhodochrous J45]
MRTGKRAVLVGPNKPLEIWEAPVDPPTGAEVLVAVEMAGVCGTDHHFYLGEVAMPGPMVLGHEGIGRVVECGPDVTTDSAGTPITEGDRVYWVPLKPCHRCHACTILEDTSLCPHQSPGRFRDPLLTPFATYTEYSLLPGGMTFFKVPEDTPSEAVIAFGCAMPTVLHAMERLGQIRFGDKVLVQGAGPVGLAATLVAGLSGAGEVVVIGAPASRLEMAKRLGATSTIDLDVHNTSEQRVAAAQEIMGGGADIVIEAAGKLPAFGEGTELVARGGRYLIVGLWSAPGTTELEPRKINNDNVRIIGSALSRPRHIYKTIQMAQQYHTRFPLTDVVSHRFGLEDAQSAIDAVGRQEPIKAVIQPGLEA